MQFVKERLGKWIAAAIIITVGILCIVAGAAMGNNDIETARGTLDAISVVIGIILIVVGSLSVCVAIIAGLVAKRGFAALAIPGGFLLAIGISLVVAKYAASLIALLLTVIPYVLIVIGAIILLDAIYTLVRAIMVKEVKAALLSIIIGVILGVGAIVLGALCIGTDPVIKYGVQLIVFGIIVVLEGLFQVLSTFIRLPDAVVVVTAEKSE